MSAVHPALVLGLGAAIVALLPERWSRPATVAAAAAGFAAAVALATGTTATVDWYGYELTVLRADELSLPFAWAFAAVMLLASVFGFTTFTRLERATALATAAAGIGVVLAGDLLTLLLFWEAKVTTVVLLISARRSSRAAPAALRYLGVHLVGGVLLMGGMVWHLATERSLALSGIDATGAGALMLAGVLFSAASFPLGAWLPDAYPEASVAGTVVLSAFTTKSAVYALARIFPGVELLVWVGVVSSLVAVAYAVVEDDLRRLLGYHIVSQVGFMVAAVGAGTPQAIAGATGHATAHIFYKGLLLMAVGAVVHATGRTRISELGGLARAGALMPALLVLYLVGAASISGIPGFSGFPAKELSVGSVSAAGHGAAGWLLKVASVGTFLSVACKLPWFTWLGRRDPADVVRSVPATMIAAMGAAAAVNVAIGVRQQWFFDRLPGAVDFDAYTAVKVTDALVLAAVTAFGFAVARRRLASAAKQNLDTDVAYRELPRWLRSGPLPAVGDRLSAVGGRPAMIDTAEASLARLPVRARRALGSGPVAPSWLLGGAIAAAMVVVLAASVAS